MTTTEELRHIATMNYLTPQGFRDCMMRETLMLLAEIRDELRKLNAKEKP